MVLKNLVQKAKTLTESDLCSLRIPQRKKYIPELTEARKVTEKRLCPQESQLEMLLGSNQKKSVRLESFSFVN